MTNYKMIQVFLLTILSFNYSTHAAQDYLVVFKSLREEGKFAWPTTSSTADSIASTFGPRTKKATKLVYDFHRGIDVAGNIGEPVVAAYAGEVFYLRDFVDGGLTMGLLHDLPVEIQLLPDKPATKRFYTYYSHLNKFVAKQGDKVKAGDIIAELGQTGTATTPHLHLEMRIGASCSLEYSLNNPTSTCNTFGYDPHVHPLVVKPAEPNNLSMSYNTEKSTADEKFVLISTSKNNPNIISYKISIIDRVYATTRKEHELDLNRRIGFDATSTTAIDSQDKTKPYLEPIPFNRDPTRWSTELVLPRAWFVKKIRREQVHVEVTDVYGTTTEFIFGNLEFWKQQRLRT